METLSASAPPDSGEPDDGPGPWGTWLSWPLLGALLLAVAFLGGSVAYFLQDRADRPGALEVGFYQDMTTHHDQAVEMSLVELIHGQDPVVQSFAREILIFQNREIGIMALRLDQWNEPVERPETAMGWMGTPVPYAEMPGLATPEQMDGLRAARGAEADARFLALMTEHHRGGVHMADYAAEHTDDAQVRVLAARMAANQAIEIEEMAQTAARLGVTLDPPPDDLAPDDLAPEDPEHVHD